jgi:HSP20 family protein
MPLIKKDAPVVFEYDLHHMRNRLRRFFEEPFGFELPHPLIDEKRVERCVWSPAVEATESPMEYLISAELPGITPEDVEVQMADGMLTVKGRKCEGKTAEDTTRTWHLWERNYGEFQRTFRFPQPIDASQVVAEFCNGILRITVPKVESTPSSARTVPISQG